MLSSAVLAAALLFQSRISSDFELRQMERQVAEQRDFLSQLSGRLNLGDLRAARSESSLARSEYGKALDIAMRGRGEARRSSDYARYATATAYAGLANAKLNDKAQAFAMFEEALRYASDDAKTWNLYASALSQLREPRKAVSAARNAVSIGGEPLDLNVYRYTLAAALIDLGEREEAEGLLQRIVNDLRSPQFDALRRSVASKEQFEIYSTARGDEAAYLSLLNRAQLRLASLYESRGNIARAKTAYQGVLDARSDDATALGALARLSTDEERERFFAEAFDANPFSAALIAEYRKTPHEEALGESAGARMRRALDRMTRKEHGAARQTLAELRRQYPDNELLRTLESENDIARQSETSEMRRLLAAWNALPPEQRAEYDTKTFTYAVAFDAALAAPEGQTVFESGVVEGVPFRFSEPTAFAGKLGAQAKLTFHVLGVTKQNGADALLLEPLGIAP